MERNRFMDVILKKHQPRPLMSWWFFLAVPAVVVAIMGMALLLTSIVTKQGNELLNRLDLQYMQDTKPEIIRCLKIYNEFECKEFIPLRRDLFNQVLLEIENDKRR